MHSLIKEYGNSIISAVVTLLVIALVFTGMGMFFMAARMSGVLDAGLIRAEAQEGEEALKKRLLVPSDNMAMKGGIKVGLYQDIFYERDGGSPIGLKAGQAKRIHINEAYLLRGDEEKSNGYEVTDQVVSEDMDGDGSRLRFSLPGVYRLVVSVTDINSVESVYQIFIHADRRRGI